MEKEFLEGLGLEADIIEKILEINGSDVGVLQNEILIEKKGRDDDKKELLFRNELIKNGATDADYIIYKHGLENIELDDSGNIKDLEGLSKNLKENYKNQFSPIPNKNLGGAFNFRKISNENEQEPTIGERLGKEAAKNNNVTNGDIYFKQ